MAETRGLTGLCTSSMAELSRTTARTAAKDERPSGLALAKCEGLPRDMLESVSWRVVCVAGRAREDCCVRFRSSSTRSPWEAGSAESVTSSV